MAKEISTNIKVTITPKSGGGSASGSLTTTEDMLVGCSGFEVTAGNTSAASISLGLSGVPKVLYIQNNDPANSVTIDNVAALNGWPQVIPAGGGVLLRPTAATVYAKASIAPVPLWVVAG